LPASYLWGALQAMTIVFAFFDNSQPVKWRLSAGSPAHGSALDKAKDFWMFNYLCNGIKIVWDCTW